MIENIDPLELNEELRIHAFEELGETVEQRTEFLQRLRHSIQALPHEKERMKDTSDRNLIRFARTKKYNFDKALHACIEYQKFQNTYGKELQNITRDEILLFKEGNLVVKEDVPLGRVIVIIRAKKVLDQFSSQYKHINPKFFLRLNYFLLELLSHNPYAQICGTVIIFSCQDLTMWDRLLVPQIASLFDEIALVKLFQILGIRMKAALCYLEPGYISWLWYLIRPFVTEVLRPRFHFCGKHLNLLHEHLKDVSVLPVSLGGDIPDDDPILTQWIQVV
jgi:hypothetical protein